MTNSRDLIRAIVDEDFVSAKELTSNLLFRAVSDELDGAKQEVAAELFTDCDDCDSDEVNEMKDYDKDGTVETAQAEVLGSRINAAVKSGKLTPAQAAKTKNKGMYR
jgi:hypothetical protein